MTYYILPVAFCVLALAGHTLALDCAAANKPVCLAAADCRDDTNLKGANAACGNVACISGTCEFVAWVDSGACATSNFLICGGDDTKCTKGPAELNYAGTCTGWANNECVYQWCPNDLAAPPVTPAPTVQPVPPTDSPIATPPPTDPPVLTVAPTKQPVVAPTAPPVATPPPTDPPVATPSPTDPPVATPSPTDPPVATPSPTEPPVATPSPTDPPVATPSPTEPPVATPSPTEAPIVAPTNPPLSTCTPCNLSSDCVDPTNIGGLKQECGNVACNAGICEYTAWNDAGACGSSNFLNCGGDDTKCTKGPSGLNYQGSCTGFGNNECIYTWCPNDEAPPAPPTPPPPPPPEGCIPCTQTSDCHDPTNINGLDQTCGNIYCETGMCRFEAWSTEGVCGPNNFQTCSGDDRRCTKGPEALVFEAICAGFGDNECQYTWCPGQLKPPPTSSPTIAPTPLRPPSLDPPEFTLDVANGFAGQAVVLTGFDFGPEQGQLLWGGISCPVLSWSRTVIKAYIADNASPGVNGLVVDTTDGRTSDPASFTVNPPSLVPTQTVKDAVAFIRDKMRSAEGGVHTAFLDDDNPDIVYLYGHHVTSEHMGLWLWNLAAVLDHALFEQAYQYVLTKMVDTNIYDLCVWGINKNTGQPFGIDGEYFNAPLDDFRVIKGLISGWMQWGDQRYLDLALRLGKGVKETSISPPSAFPAYPDGLVTTGFGWNNANPPNTYTETEIIPIDYADLWTMQFLATYDEEWLPIIAENIKLMEDAQLPNGQYWNSVIKATQSFAGDFEYQDDPLRKDNIKTIQSLWIAIHLARVDRKVSAQKALDFYKNYYFSNGNRVPEYLTPEGIEPNIPGTLSNGEVRIYSQLARLSYYLGDQAFGDELVNSKIILDQETNPSLETFGHLGKANGSVNPEAFNTLEGLIGLTYQLGSTVVSAPAPEIYPKLRAGIAWQWQLTPFFYPDDLVQTTSDETVTFYDIDLWANTPETIANIKSRNNIVGCYFEAGTWASWRAEPGSDYDRAGVSFVPEAIGSEYEPPYTNERWFNVAHPNVRENMKKILDYAKAKGCQYVEPDNVQGFERDSYCTGFETCEASCSGPDSSWLPETVCQADYDIWLDFNKFLGEEAHKRGMGVLLKNNWYQADELLNLHDGALTEQCVQYNKCWHLVPFLDADKAVLIAEYEVSDAQMCTDTYQLSRDPLFSTIKKVPALNFGRRGCCGADPCPTSSVPCGASGCV